MKYTATQLATALGIQTSTVTRHIKKGKLAAAKNDNGEYEIDAAEVVRAYPDRATVDDAGNIARQGTMQDEATEEQTDATALWRTKLDAAVCHWRLETAGEGRNVVFPIARTGAPCLARRRARMLTLEFACDRT
jgi:hypothetical protein